MAGNATAGAVTLPPNSFGSASVNGQLVGVQTASAYYPLNFGKGISATPAGSPVTVPPSVGYGMSVSPMASAHTPVPTGSVPTGASSSGTQQRGSYNGPFIDSPAMWAFVFIAFGLLWLRFVHWRRPHAREE